MNKAKAAASAVAAPETLRHRVTERRRRTTTGESEKDDDVSSSKSSFCAIASQTSGEGAFGAIVPASGANRLSHARTSARSPGSAASAASKASRSGPVSVPRTYSPARDEGGSEVIEIRGTCAGPPARDEAKS